MINKTAIVIPDQHFPLHDQSAVNCALEIIRIAKPDIFINLGDVGEWKLLELKNQKIHIKYWMK